jgi:hypothetical protein
MGRIRGKRNRDSDRYWHERRKAEQGGMVGAMDVPVCCFCGCLVAPIDAEYNASGDAYCRPCGVERGLITAMRVRSGAVLSRLEEIDALAYEEGITGKSGRAKGAIEGYGQIVSRAKGTKPAYSRTRTLERFARELERQRVIEARRSALIEARRARELERQREAEGRGLERQRLSDISAVAKWLRESTIEAQRRATSIRRTFALSARLAHRQGCRFLLDVGRVAIYQRREVLAADRAARRFRLALSNEIATQIGFALTRLRQRQRKLAIQAERAEKSLRVLTERWAAVVFDLRQPDRDRLVATFKEAFARKDRDAAREAISEARFTVYRYKHKPQSVSNIQHRKVTDAQVLEMRERYATGAWSLKALSVEYDVSSTTVSFIVSGSTYQHVGGPIHRPRHTPPMGSFYANA